MLLYSGVFLYKTKKKKKKRKEKTSLKKKFVMTVRLHVVTVRFVLVWATLFYQAVLFLVFLGFFLF